jgi:hypothetical protein
MHTYKNPNLIEGLRFTMEEVERTSGVAPDDPALVELKSILSRRVAALEHRSATGRSPVATSVESQDRESAESSLAS